MMPRPRPPFLHQQIDRHGNRIWYVRRGKGARVRIRGEYGSPAFTAAYEAAILGKPIPDKRARFAPQTFGWAMDLYRRSPEWTALSKATKKQRDALLRAAAETAGHLPLTRVDRANLRSARDRRADKPHAANNFLKAMRGFFRWAVSAELVAENQAKGVPLLKGENDDAGFHTWTEEEVLAFETRWPVGTRQRLALDLLLYTGLRRGDAVRVGRQHVKDGILTVRTEKNGGAVNIPILPPLAASIAAAPTGDLTFLVTERGRAFSKESFGTWFRKACQAAGVPGSAHGLRKAGATRAAENGATERQLMAMFAWTTGKMASHYTKAADRKKMAIEAAGTLLLAQKPNAYSLTQAPGEGLGPKKRVGTGA